MGHEIDWIIGSDDRVPIAGSGAPDPDDATECLRSIPAEPLHAVHPATGLTACAARVPWLTAPLPLRATSRRVCPACASAIASSTDG